MTSPHIVMLGGGHAAAQLVSSLRTQGWPGAITLVSEEPVLPYQRPPLSKAYLSGQVTLAQMLIKPEAAYAKAGVQLRLGVRAERIDRHRQQVHLSTGEVLTYTGLALALGARVRPLAVPGAALPGVHYLRTLADVDRLRAQMAAGSARRAVIVGGGYIGLETAAVLRTLGMDVTVLEASPRLLQRVTGVAMSDFYHRVHTEEGVTIRCNAQVRRIVGEASVTAVACEDGEQWPADLVIIGIGVLPNTELAAAAGLATGAGILVNEFAQTSDPAIVAAGDCTAFHGDGDGDVQAPPMRLESVPHAMAQATCAAATLCGQPRAYRPQPWFWSDQYDLKLQMAGLSGGHEQVVVRGDIARSRSFSVFYLSGGRLQAVDCVNQPGDFMVAKKWTAARARLDPHQLADPSQELGRLKPLSPPLSPSPLTEGNPT